MYQLAAWLALGVHAAWVAFLLVGFPLGRRNRWLRSLHLGGLILNMMLETFDLPCPLTELEKWLMSHCAPQPIRVFSGNPPGTTA